MEYDVFISHAHEDKEAVARPLARALEQVGAKVWLDEIVLRWGEPLSASIDRGLVQSRYGIVVLSPSFFGKPWTERELQGLVQKQMGERRVVILPLYFDLTNDEVRAKSPTLADAFAMEWKMGAEAIAERFKSTLGEIPHNSQTSRPLIDGRAMVRRIKSLIQGGQQIAVEDALVRGTDELLARLSSKEFDPSLRTETTQETFEEFKRRIREYEASTEGLIATLATVAYYGGSEHHLALKRSLEQVGDEPNDLGKSTSGGINYWVDLRGYPSILAFHSVGCAAIASQKFGNLRPAFEAKISERSLSNVRVPMLARVKPHEFARGPLEQWLVSNVAEIKTKVYTPAEDHLAEYVSKLLSWFGVGKHESERIFDQWLMLAQIGYLGIQEGQGRSDTYFSVGRWWRVLSEFRGWDRTPQAELTDWVRAEAEDCPILQSGVASDASTFLARADHVREMVLKVKS